MRFVQLKSALLKKTLLGAVLCVPALSVQSQSLPEAVQIALAQYPTILAAQARFDASKSDIIRAQGQHYPQVSWQGTTSNYSGVTADGPQAGGLIPNDSWIQSPNVTMNIWSGWRIQSEVERTRSISSARGHQQRITRDEVALLALEGYMIWARNIELVSLARKNVEAHRRILNDVRKITQVDQGRRIDQDQAEVRFENATLQLQQRETDLAVSIQRLERMMLGPLPKAPTGFAKVAGTLPTSPAEALTAINDTHPQIAVQLSQIDAAKAGVRSAQSGHSPTVNMSYGKQVSQGSGQGDYITQVAINVPIFSGGQTYGAVGSAKNELVAVEQGLQEARLTVRERLLSVWPELLSARERKVRGERQVQTALKLVTGYDQQFRVGRRSLLDLLTVQNDLYNYQTNTIIATFDERIAHARVLAAMGRLALAYQAPDTKLTAK
ncbi:TolC family protein [Zwartia sp.]|uniref:TolC family protein n=1 Tax=Zwartia sp. TaxID=2978004 RepID=UPI002719A998|nr:TolC family protein [Zwartia sp.]MDO9025931.1 TolC family protein [Zwartia sp.]